MKNIYKALSDFQSECPIIHKDTQGFGYTYADLPKIFSVIMPLLKSNGLGFTQLLDGGNLKTILFHVESGETIESVTPIPTVQLAKMNEYQAYGSGVTYYRRYALSSILGIVTDKDTDASGEQVKAEIWMSARQFELCKTLLLSQNETERSHGIKNFEAFKVSPYRMTKDQQDELEIVIINTKNNPL